MELNEEIIRHFYHEDSDVYKCEACGAPETKQKAHSVCSRCKKTRYCSRECQIKDWPKHKPVCKILETKGSGRPPIGEQSSWDRLEKFKEQYKPLVQLMVYWALKIPGGLKGDEFLVEVILKDLPQSKSPSICIDSYKVAPIASAGNAVEQHIRAMQKHPPDDCQSVGFAVLLYTDDPSGEPIASVMPFAFEEEEDEGLLAPGAVPPSFFLAMVQKEAIKYRDTINDMAKGNKKEFKKAAKRKPA